MEWLQLGPLDPWSYAFIVWFFGLVAGYCVGRLHSTWITFKHLSKRIK